ncbi:hypothetical protein Hanom_Chr09g00804951 [Helianthus anomalus]
MLYIPAIILAASFAYTTKTEQSSFISSGLMRSAKRDLHTIHKVNGSNDAHLFVNGSVLVV